MELLTHLPFPSTANTGIASLSGSTFQCHSQYRKGFTALAAILMLTHTQEAHCYNQMAVLAGPQSSQRCNILTGLAGILLVMAHKRTHCYHQTPALAVSRSPPG